MASSSAGDLSDASTLPAGSWELQRRLNAVVHDSLHIVLPGVAALFIVVSGVTYLTVPATHRTLLIGMDLIVAILLGFLYGLYRRGELGPADTHPALAGVAIYVLAQILLDQFLYPYATGFLFPVLVVMGVGAFLLHPTWFTVVFGAGTATSLAMVYLPPLGAHAASDPHIPIIAGLALAALTFSTRRRAYASLERARVRETERARELQSTKRDVELSERRLRTVIRNAPLVLFALDEDLRFTLSDGRGLQVLGLEPGEVVGKHLEEVYPGREDIRDQVERALEGEEVRVENEVDGKVFDVVYVPFTMGVEGSRGVLGVAMDVTERMEAKEELEHHARALEVSNRDLEQFAYAAAHDLQEPLRTVVSYLQLLDRRHREELSGDAREVMGYAVDAAKRMKTLVDALLAYSRIQPLEPRKEEMALEEVMEDVTMDLKVTLEASDASLTWDEDLPPVRYDPELLREVLLNLVSNGLKFNDEDRPPEVHVSARREGGRVLVEVRDNGIGIDPAHQDRIFELFKRLHPTSRYPGTGIGLAMVKRIVELHGGEVQVESEAGKGSTFRFTAPAA